VLANDTCFGPQAMQASELQTTRIQHLDLFELSVMGDVPQSNGQLLTTRMVPTQSHKSCVTGCDATSHFYLCWQLAYSARRGYQQATWCRLGLVRYLATAARNLREKARFQGCSKFRLRYMHYFADWALRQRLGTDLQ